MSDSDKSYGQILFETIDDTSLTDEWEKRWEHLDDFAKLCLNKAAQAVIDEYKRRHEDDTKPLGFTDTASVTLTATTPADVRGIPMPFDPANPQRNYPYDSIRKDWFPRENYTEDSI